MRIVGLTFIAAMFLAGCQTLHAETAGRDLSAMDPIERVRIAYQVDRLRSAKTIRLEDNVRQYWPDHEYSPTFHEMAFQRRHLILDIQNEASSYEFVTRITNAYYHGREVITDGRRRDIIYPSATYQEVGEADPVTQYGPAFRSSDVMLAYWLDRAAGTARIDGETMWLGNIHDQVTFDFPNSPPLTILIRKDTGFISKMHRQVGDVIVSYTFYNHVIQDGIPVAQDHNVYGGADWIFYSIDRRVVVNDPDDAGVFQIEPDIKPAPEPANQSDLTVEALTEAMHHVGQEESYTSFIKTSRGLVAYGLDAGFAERLQAYRNKTSDQTPLAFAVISSHHRNRMAGAIDAHAAGATLLVTPDAEARTREALGEGSQSARIETVPDNKTIGTVTVLTIASGVASQNLVVFNTDDGAIIQTAHYAAPFLNVPLFADNLSKTFMDSLQPLGLNPKLIVSTESKRAERWDVFEAMVAQSKRNNCARKRRICEGWQ